MQRRAGHLGDVLPADREIDLDAVLDLAAGLFGQAQQRVRDALLDLFGRHFEHAGLGSCSLLPTVCSALAASAGNFAISCGHAADGHAQRHAVDGRDGGRWIVLECHRLGDAEHSRPATRSGPRSA